MKEKDPKKNKQSDRVKPSQKRVFHELLIRFRDYFNVKKITLREGIRRVLLLACVVVFVVAGYEVVDKWYTDYVDKINNENRVKPPVEDEDKNNLFNPSEEDLQNFDLMDPEKFDGIQSSYPAYRRDGKPGDQLTGSGRVKSAAYEDILKTNSDVVGHVYIADTNVDHYVLQKRTDNDYYLHHTIEHKKTTSASIFMDYRNRIYGEDKNTILYGHNMKNETMFHTLHKYKDKEFAEAHRYITFNTLYENMTWEVFASFKTNINFDYIRTSFRTDEDYAKFLKDCKAKSMFQYDADPGIYDRILTLSTCDSRDDVRYVVQAVLISREER